VSSQLTLFPDFFGRTQLLPISVEN